MVGAFPCAGADPATRSVAGISGRSKAAQGVTSPIEEAAVGTRAASSRRHVINNCCRGKIPDTDRPIKADRMRGRRPSRGLPEGG